MLALVCSVEINLTALPYLMLEQGARRIPCGRSEDSSLLVISCIVHAPLGGVFKPSNIVTLPSAFS